MNNSNESAPRPSIDQETPLDPWQPEVVVWGCGYLGTTHAATLAEMHPGLRVLGVDPDPRKVEILQAGHAPFFEPGLDDILQRHVVSGNLRFSTSPLEPAAGAVHFVCVGTPQRRDSQLADLRFISQAMSSIISCMTPNAIVVGKSTVPVGTAHRYVELVRAAGGELVWNPEFLREGTAVEDCMRPDRIVLGVPADVRNDAVARLAALYEPALATGAKWSVCDLPTAELVKVSANTFLALKVSYVNALAELCERTGADVTDLADALGVDPRIGRRFLDAGIGFGGGCLPKDIRGFASRAAQLDCPDAADLVGIVDRINLKARTRAAARIVALLERAGRAPDTAVVVVLGASFKPGSDDVRDSPALALGAELENLVCTVRFVDPHASPGPGTTVLRDPGTALPGADAVILATDWPEYVEIDPARAASVMRTLLAFDGRSRWEPERFTRAGFVFSGVGRPDREPAI